jgi:hypothetical protein
MARAALHARRRAVFLSADRNAGCGGSSHPGEVPEARLPHLTVSGVFQVVSRDNLLSPVAWFGELRFK